MIEQFGAAAESVPVLWHNPSLVRARLAFGAKVGAWNAIRTATGGNRSARHLRSAEGNDLLQDARTAIRVLAERGYVDDSSATLALLALDRGHRRVICQQSELLVLDAVDRRDGN